MQAPQFLTQLYNGVSGIFEIRLLHKSGDYKLAKKLYRPVHEIPELNWDYLHEMNQEYHVYHRVNVSQVERSRKADISHIVALYVDVDNPSDAAYHKLESMACPPNAIVFSGGGFHGYWCLRDPLPVDSDTVADIERIQAGLIMASTGDPAAKDVTRILRTPGYHNIKDKYNHPPVCEVVYFDNEWGMRYPLNTLDVHYGKLAAPVRPRVSRAIPQAAYSNDLPKYVTDYLAYGANEGERNKTLYVAARYYLDAGKSQGEAEQDLLSRAQQDGLTKSEAMGTIRSAFRNSPSPYVQSTMSARYAIGDSKK